MRVPSLQQSRRRDLFAHFTDALGTPASVKRLCQLQTCAPEPLPCWIRKVWAQMSFDDAEDGAGMSAS